MKIVKISTKATLLLLSMVTMMSNVAIMTMLPHIGNIFKDVHNIELLSRLMITLPSLSIALFAPFLSGLIDAFGKKNSAIIALFAFSLFGTAGLYLQTIYEILFSRFLFGLSIAVLMIVSTSLVGDYFNRERRHQFMGLQSAFTAIGGVIFIVGGGFLSDINWRYPFAIYISGLLVLVFVFMYLAEHKTHAQQLEEEEHLLNHNLWYIYLLAFTLMLIFYILPTQMPFLIINVFHASDTLTGEIISTAFIFNAIGALTFVKLKKRFKFSQIYAMGMLLFALGFTFIGYVNNVYLFFITSPIMGFGGGILMANTTAWMLSMAHHTKRVKSSGYLTSALFGGQFFSPILFHPIVEYFGVQKFFVVVGVSIFVFLIVNHLFSKRFKYEK